jgi:hypothetical protein
VKSQRDDWDEDERRALHALEAELEQLRARHRNDPPFELLRAAHEDALPESLQEPLSEHLRQSAWSRALVEGGVEAEPPLDASAEQRILNRIHRSTRSTPASRWTLRAWAPLLAAAAVLVIIVAVLRRPGPDSTPEPQPGSSARNPPTSAPPPPRFTLPLDTPDVKLTPQALVLRSGTGRGFADDIAPALKAYTARNYVEAEKDLAALKARYPNAVEIAFYHGITELLLNDAARAIQSLQTARRLDDGSFAADIAWYLAVAYERAGDGRRARGELETLCRQTNSYAAKACAAAPQIKPE